MWFSGCVPLRDGAARGPGLLPPVVQGRGARLPIPLPAEDGAHRAGRLSWGHREQTDVSGSSGCPQPQNIQKGVVPVRGLHPVSLHPFLYLQGMEITEPDACHGDTEGMLR